MACGYREPQGKGQLRQTGGCGVTSSLQGLGAAARAPRTGYLEAVIWHSGPLCELMCGAADMLGAFIIVVAVEGAGLQTAR